MYVRNEQIVSDSIPDGCVLFNPSTGCTHILNTTSTYIWENCEGKTLDELVDSFWVIIVQPPKREQLYDDVKEMISQFIENKLIIQIK